MDVKVLHEQQRHVGGKDARRPTKCRDDTDNKAGASWEVTLAVGCLL